MITVSIDPKAVARTDDGTLVNGAFVVARGDRPVLQTRSLTLAVSSALSLSTVARSNIRVVPATLAGLTLPPPHGEDDGPVELMPADFQALYLPLTAGEDADGNGVPDAAENAFARVSARIKRRGTAKAHDLRELSESGVPAFAYLRNYGDFSPESLRDLSDAPADTVLPVLVLGYVRQFGVTHAAQELEAYVKKVADESESEAVTPPTPQQTGGYYPDDDEPAPLIPGQPRAADAAVATSRDPTPDPEAGTAPPPTDENVAVGSSLFSDLSKVKAPESKADDAPKDEGEAKGGKSGKRS